METEQPAASRRLGAPIAGAVVFPDLTAPIDYKATAASDKALAELNEWVEAARQSE